MKKEKITLQEVWKENGINFTVMNGGGYVDTDAPEMLLPTGTELENKPDITVNKPITDSNMLLPCGFKLLANGQIETPEERIQANAEQAKNKETDPVNDDADDNLLMPNIE